jgi:two-component system, sensor histidine kinase and response regulator
MNDLTESGYGSASLLIVDDNPQNLQVLGKMLQENNFEIEFAISGTAATDWLTNRHFDLILLDINMPGMDGFEVCTWIRARPELDNIPIIFLSADNDRESILKGFQMGAQDYIIKPFDSRELIVRVRTHLTLKRSLEKLENLNRSLEEKVAERTRELKESNEKLADLNLRLIDLDKVKSEFLNIISHEIRTPLNGIIGPLELLRETEEKPDIDLLIDILDTSVQRLERFSLDALLITRLKTRMGDMKRETLNISELIKELTGAQTEKLRSKKINLFTNDKLRGQKIFGEFELVKKSISEILTNAIFFTPEGGTITVSLSCEGEFLLVEVRDNGQGFTPGTTDNLLNLFTTGDEQRDNSIGLGLPIARLVMEAHRGKIALENNPDGGANVKLYFPIADN